MKSSCLFVLCVFACFRLSAQEIIINDEEITLDDIAIYVDGSVQENNSASIRGEGEIISLTVSLNGGISPGFSVGQININGDLAWGSSGTFTVEIEGLAGEGLAGGNDALFVDGDVSVDGTLDISIPNGFTPSIGDEFILVNYTGSVGGTFDTVNLPPELSGWTVYYGDLIANAIVLANILVLPVEIIHFDAERQDQRARLFWETSIETNNKGFDVQHSIDGTRWSSIGWVESVGNSNQQTNYELFHENPAVGRNYYHLKQIDNNGTVQQTEIRFVDFDSNSSALLYPNPAGDYVNISVQNGQPNSIAIYDSKGVLRLTATGNSTTIALTGLEAGAYFCALSFQDRKDLVIPFIKQ